MRRLACLLLLGAMHPALASAPAPAPAAQSAAETAVPTRDEPAPGSLVTPAASVADAVPQAVTPTAAGPETASSAAAKQTAPAAAVYVPKTPYDNTPYRFDMSQQGKRMSAADFDAWMKSRGLRVAGGKPAEAAAAEPEAPSAPVAGSCQPTPTQAC